MKTGALLKKVKAHLKSLDRGGLEIQTAAISIDQRAADEIAVAGHIALDATQIERLRKLLELYAQWFQVDIAQQSSPKANKHLDMLTNQLGDLIETLGAIKFGTIQMSQQFDVNEAISLNTQTIFREASVGAPRFKRELAALSAVCKEMRNQNSTAGRRPNRYLPSLMNDLAVIFMAAGGHSTRISRGTSATRQSKFIDFAWEAMRLLPEQMRHSTKAALAIWWEKNRPEPEPKNTTKRTTIRSKVDKSR